MPRTTNNHNRASNGADNHINSSSSTNNKIGGVKNPGVGGEVGDGVVHLETTVMDIHMDTTVEGLGAEEEEEDLTKIRTR